MGCLDLISINTSIIFNEPHQSVSAHLSHPSIFTKPSRLDVLPTSAKLAERTLSVKVKGLIVSERYFTGGHSGDKFYCKLQRRNTLTQARTLSLPATRQSSATATYLCRTKCACVCRTRYAVADANESSLGHKEANADLSPPPVLSEMCFYQEGGVTSCSLKTALIYNTIGVHDIRAGTWKKGFTRDAWTYQIIISSAEHPSCEWFVFAGAS